MSGNNTSRQLGRLEAKVARLTSDLTVMLEHKDFGDVTEIEDSTINDSSEWRERCLAKILKVVEDNMENYHRGPGGFNYVYVKKQSGYGHEFKEKTAEYTQNNIDRRKELMKEWFEVLKEALAENNVIKFWRKVSTNGPNIWVRCELHSSTETMALMSRLRRPDVQKGNSPRYFRSVIKAKAEIPAAKLKHVAQWGWGAGGDDDDAAGGGGGGGGKGAGKGAKGKG